MIRCAGSPLKFENTGIKQSFLAKSLDLAIRMRDDERLSEDINDLVFQNQGGIVFDDYGHHDDIYNIDDSKNSRDNVSPF